MTQQTAEPPARFIMAGVYDHDVFRSVLGGSTLFRFALGNSSADGWDVPFPLRVTRLSFSVYINFIGATNGAIRCQIYKNVVNSSNLAFKVEWVGAVSAGWYYATDSTVDVAGMDLFEPGDTMICRVVSKPSAFGGTSFSNYSSVIDYEQLG